MKIFKKTTDDGHIIRGLLSEASNKKIIIIHFHGFGGDCFANHFVQIMHEQFPPKGISFLSVNTRYSGYLVEEYSENNVSYSGASIYNYTNVENDVGELVNYFRAKYDSCILQGHSFGTNLVKLYLRKHNSDIPSIFLSPADSVGLYNSWKNVHKIEESIFNFSSGYFIRADNFGMLTDYGEYQIPITDIALKKLLVSEIFNEWSFPIKDISNKSLVIKGSGDPVSNYGTTKTSQSLYELLPNSYHYNIKNAKHIFSNYENELLDLISICIHKLIKVGVL
jgi:pimeloyl-ACP methyl ester carboxylesterase